MTVRRRPCWRRTAAEGMSGARRGPRSNDGRVAAVTTTTTTPSGSVAKVAFVDRVGDRRRVDGASARATGTDESARVVFGF